MSLNKNTYNKNTYNKGACSKDTWFIILWAGFLFFCFAQFYVHAQQSSSDMIVTGKRQPISWAQSGSGVSILTAEDIKQANYEFIFDAITDLPGVTGNRSGSFGGLAHIRLRGASSNGHVSVLIDGIRMNDPSGPDNSFNFAYLDTYAVERIEVLKGGQSSFWGADAISGVVNITTKAPEDFSITAFQEVGSYQSFRGGASVSDAYDKFAYRVSVSKNISDGISKADEVDGNVESDGFEQFAAYGRFDFNVSDALDLIAQFNWSDSEYEFDGFSYALQRLSDADQLGDDSQLGMSLVARLTGETIEQDIQLAFTRAKRKHHGADYGTPLSVWGERYQARYQAAVTLSKTARFGFGAETEEVRQNDGGDVTDEDDMHALFAFYELSPFDSLTLSVGGRYDEHSSSGSETTTRFGFAWQANDYWAMRGSIGEGFKPPNLVRLNSVFCYKCRPAKNLKPELSDSWEIGFDFTSPTQSGHLSITYFEQDITNLIDWYQDLEFDRVNDEVNHSGYRNIAYAESAGVEVAADFALTPYLTIAAHHTWLFEAKDGNGHKLGRLPKREGQVRLSYEPDNPFSGNLIWRYNGREPDRNGGNVPYLDSWVRLDVNMAWQLSKRAEIYAHIENILDEHYQSVLSYGEPDRSGRIGLRLRW